MMQHVNKKGEVDLFRTEDQLPIASIEFFQYLQAQFDDSVEEDRLFKIAL